MSEALQQLSPDLFVVRDSCNVYLLRSGREAVAIDFGTGRALDALDELGVEHISDVLMTHHHRDQAQGLHRAAALGSRIWVPPVERDLFADVESMWQTRTIENTYDVRTDRFSLRSSVPVAGTLPEYRRQTVGGRDFEILPTPGHTVGSDSLLVEIDGRTVAFTGDLIAGPGKVWSLRSTQWTYNGGEGLAASILSLLDLRERAIDLILPSHGEPMAQPREAIDLLVERLHLLNRLREQNRMLLEFHESPYNVITPHLLENRTSNANSHVLLSESGKALVIDFGYDFVPGDFGGTGRASRRPWLRTLPALKRDHGIDRIDVAVPTHYHDDHVAGFNLLREVEGTQIWAADSVAPAMADPAAADLPCLWYDPIPADRSIPLLTPVRWEEYELTFHPLPGHTPYAVAIAFEVDGRRVLAVGDQQRDEPWIRYVFLNQRPVADNLYLREAPPPRLANYTYANGFDYADFRASAELYARLSPELMLFGHWPRAWVGEDYFREQIEAGTMLEQLHQELLPLDEVDLGGTGFTATMRPYRVSARPGEPFQVEVSVRNPFASAGPALVRLGVPEGWTVDPSVAEVPLAPRGDDRVTFTVRPDPAARGTRIPVAADVTIGDRPLGEQAEALVWLDRPAPPGR